MAPENPLPRILQTARLTLRPARVEDAPEIFEAYAQDPDVCRFMIWRPHRELAETRAFLARCVRGWEVGSSFAYAILAPTRDAARVVGMLDARPLWHLIDIGYVLARSAWGQGLMPEAIAFFAQEALSDPGVFRIQASCDVDNLPSQRALEKAGFSREGLLERFTVHPAMGPEPRPCFMYARCR
jgi:ribosomal-protein-alanine N-acetyltransferase